MFEAMAVAAGAAAVLVGGVVVLVRRQGHRPWELEQVEDGRWRLVNSTGHRAFEVHVRVEGALVRLVGDGELGDLDRGEAEEFRVVPDASATADRAPTVRVTWAIHADGGRESWRVRFDP